MRALVLSATLLSATLITGAGCIAPAMAMGDINAAQAALSAAKTADAPRLAPYEYTLAELYLERARDQRGASYYQEAYECARKATSYARQATEKAENHH